MKRPMPIVAVALLLLAATASIANAHGSLSLPKPQFTVGDTTAPAGTIDGPSALPGKSYATDPASNTAEFMESFKASEYKTLKALVEKNAQIPECGNTQLGEPQELPDQVEWSHGDGEGFTASHEGPCEIWCDENVAFFDENCPKNFPSAPARLPYDRSKCAGARTLKIIWLALHQPQWQIYLNCAAINGGNASEVNPDDEDCEQELHLKGDDEDCEQELELKDEDPNCLHGLKLAKKPKRRKHRKRLRQRRDDEIGLSFDDLDQVTDNGGPGRVVAASDE